jgi:general secretion pathway protein A
MYLEFYGLSEYPFQLAEPHARAKAYMDYSIWNRDGFVVITGDVGTGKTTLIQKLLSELDQNVLVAKIFQTQLNEVEFLQAVLNEYNIKAFNAGKVELLDMLSTFFIEQFMESKQLVLVVDEAQNLSYRVLEEIRMLSGLETQKEKMLHVILVGQPELRDKLESAELYQLLQRVRLRFHLDPLSKDDVRNYVQHRLRAAGAGDSELFENGAYSVIYQYSGGIPRLINTLCDTALTFGYAEERKKINAATVRAAAKELQWPVYSQRPRRSYSGSTAPEAPSEPAADVIERRRDVDTLSNNLDRLDSLLPSMLAIADRMIRIEHQLKRLAEKSETETVDQVEKKKGA